MGKQQRIIVQTTPHKKQALDQLLLDVGSTLTDWFNLKVEESIAPYIPETQLKIEEISSLEALKDSKKLYTDLSSLDWGFAESDTRYLSHDIHPYPAKFIPQIPSNLIARLSLPGETVWDPFGGSGTTALEAILLGRRAISTDANPIAEIIGKAKTITLTKEQEDTLCELQEKLLLTCNSEETVSKVVMEKFQELKEDIPSIPNIEKWFHPIAIRELACLRSYIESLPSEECRVVARAAFSKTVLKVSYQDCETRYAYKPKDIKSGFVFRCFANDLEGTLIKVRQISPLLRFRQASFFTIDLRQSIVSGKEKDNLRIIEPNSIDLIITSPPYPNANDYHLYHRFRLFWLGYDPRELAKIEIGSHLRHQKESTGFENYIAELKPCLDNCFEALRPGRFAVFILGDAIFNGKRYETAKEIENTAKNVNFECIGTIERPIHRTKRSFIVAARRAKSEKLLILRKPNKKVLVTLGKSPYKLWPYERDLWKREISTVTKKHPIFETAEECQLRLDALEVDKLKRLTFTHRLKSIDIGIQPTWQAILENGSAFSTNSIRKDPKYVTHGIHPYKGKFYPQLAKALFNLANLSPGQTVLDPFCGSGTVLLEGYLNGLHALGCDANPLAVKIAKAKIEILTVDPYICDKLFVRVLEKLTNGSSNDCWFNYFPKKIQHEIESWFPKPVANKLGWLLNTINDIPEKKVQEFLRILTSRIIRQISQQDPKDLRIRRRESPIKDAPVFQLFKQVLVEQRSRLQNFARRSLLSPYKFLPSRVWLGNSCQSKNFHSNFLTMNSVDAVVTSPPYATALPYIDTDRLSILVLFEMTAKDRSPFEENLTGSREISKTERLSLEEKIEKRCFECIPSKKAQAIISRVYNLNSKANVGFRRKNMAALLYRYSHDITLAMENIHTLLKVGGQALFVIGDNRTQAGNVHIKIETTKILQETGLALGWKLLESIPITVTTENLRHTKNSITENTVLWFKKTG